MSEKISNYNSISTAIDRLVIERVKMAQFQDRADKGDETMWKKVELQERLVSALRGELAVLLDEIVNKGYSAIKEERTFK